MQNVTKGTHLLFGICSIINATEQTIAIQTIKLNLTWSFSSGVEKTFAFRYCSCMTGICCAYCQRLQMHPANTKIRKLYAIHFHCLDDNCQLPAKATGKRNSGSLILVKCIHMLLSSVQNQVMNGIKNKKLIPNKKEFRKKLMSC